MRTIGWLLTVGLLLGNAGVVRAQNANVVSGTEWSFNATIIEACSCPMFCQCYFNSEPAAAGGHAGHAGMAGHFCKFNNAFKVNKGSFGSVKLDGAKFWVGGDLGGDFSKGMMDWAVLTFDPSVTKEQRDGIQEILTHVYPVKWNSFTVAKDAPIDWTPGKDHAEAKLDGGKAAEVVLKRPAGSGNTDEPIVIKNLKYWGVPRNEGFVLMGPNEVEAYRSTDKAFEFKGTNGFMITIDMTSKDVKA
ncbi:MAG: DUF1326 domain-containing protein [Planctomycetes bacterium]|nr:DUF1326 domain-containing protein [Planctomycetota bacterium]MBI3844754.1 DUF1326 domain-containing protein [Planctomycetota bacterium]